MKKNVAILYGGPSSEHEVSIKSAQNVLEHIDQAAYEVLEIFISKDGLFHISDTLLEAAEAIAELKNLHVDVVFPVLHGSFGEDGKLQKLLEESAIAFIGSGSQSSALAMDKYAANAVFEKVRLHVPKSQILSRGDDIALLFPIIIKPIDEGSSVGLFKLENEEEYHAQTDTIFRNHGKMLVQECIMGREFTCGVIDIDRRSTPLPVTEIILNTSKTFDYDTKYTAGACLEVTPADVPEDIFKRIQDVALTCHNALGCMSISRTDVILSDNDIYVLETNTLPGMTQTSFIPAQAKAHGICMKELITHLILSALRR